MGAETSKTYTIVESIGLDKSSGLDDTTLEIVIAVFVIVVFLGITVFIVMSDGGSDPDMEGDSGSIIAAIAASNQSKLPVTLNINTSPVYYPK